MQDYQLTFLLSPELDEKKLEDFSEKFGEMLRKEVKVSQSEAPKKVKLSYPILKKQDAFLACFEFQAEAQKIEELKTKIKKQPEILRFLLIKKEKTLEKKERKPKARKAFERKKVPVTEKVELKKIEKDLEKILDFTHEGKLQGEA